MKNKALISSYNFDRQLGAAVVVQLVLVQEDVVEEQDPLLLLQLFVVDLLQRPSVDIE